MDEQLGELIVTRAESGKRAIVPAHAAIDAIFPAEIGDLTDGPDKTFPPEMIGSRLRGALVQRVLLRAASPQHRRARNQCIISHYLIYSWSGLEGNSIND